MVFFAPLRSPILWYNAWRERKKNFGKKNWKLRDICESKDRYLTEWTYWIYDWFRLNRWRGCVSLLCWFVSRWFWRFSGWNITHLLKNGIRHKISMIWAWAKIRLMSIGRMRPSGWMCVRKNVANVKMLPFTKSNFQLRRRHDGTIGKNGIGNT